jgi:hypothetical protein
MRPKAFLVAGSCAYAVGLVCLLLDRASFYAPTSVLVLLWLSWLSALLWCLVSAPAPKWKATWVLGSVALMYRTTESLCVLLIWSIGGFAP